MSVVYFIQAGDAGPIKIGFTATLRERLAMLQTGCPDCLVVMATIPGGQPLEAAYHRALEAHRHRSEWFRPHPEVLAHARRAASGLAIELATAANGERQHSDIVAAADVPAIAGHRGVSVHTVRSWGQRGRIPAEHWPAFVITGVATLEELASGVKPRRAESAAA